MKKTSTLTGAILNLKGILRQLWETLTRRNVILKHACCLLVSPIYPLLCEGYSNEDRQYAFLLLAMEAVSFILDRLGRSHWGYLLASFLLSALILQTTMYAYFIKRSIIESEAQQLCAVEIVFSVLQLIISCYCLVRTLSGVKTNYSSSVFPLAYAIISVVFTFKSKENVSCSSSDAPPDIPSNQSGIVSDAGEIELMSIRTDSSDTPVDNVDPSDPTPVSVHISDAKEDPFDKSVVSVRSTSASVPQANTLRQRRKQSQFQVDPLNPTLDSAPTSSSVVFNHKSQKDVPHLSVDSPPDSPSNQFVLVSAPTSDAEVDPLDEPLVSVPTSDAEVDPLDEPLVSVPTSDVEVDPLDEPLVSVPTSDAKFDPLDEPLVSVPSSSATVPQANKLCQRSKQSYLKELVFAMEPRDDKAKKKAMKAVSRISGVDSIAMDMKENRLTVIGQVDPIEVVSQLRKQQYCTEIISVGPAKQPKTREGRQPVRAKILKGLYGGLKERLSKWVRS